MGCLQTGESEAAPLSSPREARLLVACPASLTAEAKVSRSRLRDSLTAHDHSLVDVHRRTMTRQCDERATEMLQLCYNVLQKGMPQFPHINTYGMLVITNP